MKIDIREQSRRKTGESSQKTRSSKRRNRRRVADRLARKERREGRPMETEERQEGAVRKGGPQKAAELQASGGGLPRNNVAHPKANRPCRCVYPPHGK